MSDSDWHAGAHVDNGHIMTAGSDVAAAMTAAIRTAPPGFTHVLISGDHAGRTLDVGPAKDLLGRVISLYALSSIEEDRAWFIEHGRLTTTRSRAVTATVNELCGQLRPQARTLVDALGVPEGLITAPIVH